MAKIGKGRMKFAGRKLFQLRQERGLSQEQLAGVLEVSCHSIGLWETEKSVPTMKNFMAICDFFNVSAEYFTGDEIEQVALPSLAEEAAVAQEEKESPAAANKARRKAFFKQFGFWGGTVVAALGALACVFTAIFVGIALFTTKPNTAEIVYNVENIDVSLFVVSCVGAIVLLAVFCALVNLLSRKKGRGKGKEELKP